MEHNNKTNATTTILNITSVQSLSAGVYNCTAGIIDGDIMTNSTDLCLKGEDAQIFNKNCISYFVLVDDITINGNYTNLTLGDFKEYNCTSDYRESGVTVQWNSSDVVFNNPLIITVNQSINNTRYTCIVTVDGNPDNCKTQTKDVLLTVRGKFK